MKYKAVDFYCSINKMVLLKIIADSNDHTVRYTEPLCSEK